MAEANFVDKTIWTGENLDILRGVELGLRGLDISRSAFQLEPELCGAHRFSGGGGGVPGHVDAFGLEGGVDGVDCGRAAGDVQGDRDGGADAGERDASVPVHDGGAAAGDAASAEGYGFRLSAL